MGICCVDGCEPDDNEDIIYFPFPVKPALRRKWRDVIKASTKLHVDSKVCSRHFSTSDYEEVRGKLRLKGKVVPSLFNHSRNSPKDPTPSGSPIPSPAPSPSSEDPPEPPSEDQEPLMPECVQTLMENCDEEENCTIECAPEGLLQHDSSSEPEDIHKEDIEDIIANYHIKQNRKLVERLKASELCERERERCEKSAADGAKDDTKEPEPSKRQDSGQAKSTGTTGSAGDVIVVEADPGHTDPVYIEIPVETGNKGQLENRDDCLMVLENVQVDIDPSTLMLDPPEDLDKGDDPISLLTSSDEDDVIIQEPHIDTVEVSDETDEDDVPLVRLVKTEEICQSNTGGNLSKILWGNLYEYYCMHCQFTTTKHAEYKEHKLTHTVGKVMLLCEICNFTTASKAQFVRHKKRHREEKRYKCNLCEYRAKHNMSLIYHMKSHQKELHIETINLDSLPFKNKLNVKKIRYAFKCHTCDFKSNERRAMLSHVKNCCTDKKFACRSCDYKTKRRSDLTRHMLKRHNCEADDEDDEDYVPK